MKNIEHYHKVLNRVDGMLTFSESKIGFMVAYIGLLLAVLGSQADNFRSLLQRPEKGIVNITLILLVLMIINLVVLFYYIGKVLFPRLQYSRYNSMAYFGDISKLTEQDYLQLAKSRSEEETVSDVLTQIHVVSSIVNQKFMYIQQATRLLYPYTLLWVLIIATIIAYS